MTDVSAHAADMDGPVSQPPPPHFAMTVTPAARFAESSAVPPVAKSEASDPETPHDDAGVRSSGDSGSHLHGLDALIGNPRNSFQSLRSHFRQRSYSVDRRPSDDLDQDYTIDALIGGFSTGTDDMTLLPSRWWFASSAFPMVAGTLGPVASAFSICALVRPWRQIIEPGESIDTATTIPDPSWLTIINAIQLAIALIANMFLLLNMARRIRFTIAQPITMMGWYVSSFTLIGLAATASGPLRDGVDPDVNMVWSQAFYYAIYSAVLYMLDASLMIVTFLGAWFGHYPKDFQLTNSQRTLMLQTIMFLMYLLIGALIFSNTEDWQYLDAVYWADVTLFTIGFGDFSVQSTLGRALLFPYALIGVISLGLVIGSIRSLALERGQRRLDARIMEKNRVKFINSLAKNGKGDILRPIPSGDGVDERTASFDGARPNTNGLTEYERRQQEFNIMRKIQHDANNKRRWVAMATSGGTWFALWLVGAYIFKATEEPYQGWDYFDGFYLAFVSLTTIGYGDLTPISNAGRSFFVFWSLLALPTTTILISNAGDTIVKAVSDATDILGRVTILPGEHSVKRDLKAVVHAVLCGTVFDDVDIEDTPPGLLGAAQPAPILRNRAEKRRAAKALVDAENMVQRAERLFHKQRAVAAPTPKREGDDYDGNNKNKNGSGNNFRDEETETCEQDIEKANAAPLCGSRLSTPSSGTMLDKTAEGGGQSGAHTSESTPTMPAEAGDGPTNLIKHLTSHRHDSNSAPSKTGAIASAMASAAAAATASAAGAVSSYDKSGDSTQLAPRVHVPRQLPKTRSEYHCLLMDEIARVTEHMHHSPPRKYTFEEWAWFLKLIGEDEHRADHHRHASMKTSKKDRKDRKDKKAAKGDHTEGGATMSWDANSVLNPDHEDLSSLQWSWVGARSPLMSSQDEAEWILDKLMRRLRVELRTVRDAEIERRTHTHTHPSLRQRAQAAAGGGHSHGHDHDRDNEHDYGHEHAHDHGHEHEHPDHDRSHDNRGDRPDPTPYSHASRSRRHEPHA